MECILCFKSLKNESGIDVKFKSNTENSLIYLIELYLPFFDIQSINDKSSFMCSNCATSLRNFHGFYQRTERNLFFKKSNQTVKDQIESESEDFQRIYEILEIERLENGITKSDNKSKEEEVNKPEENQIKEIFESAANTEKSENLLNENQTTKVDKKNEIFLVHEDQNFLFLLENEENNDNLVDKDISDKFSKSSKTYDRKFLKSTKENFQQTQNFYQNGNSTSENSSKHSQIYENLQKSTSKSSNLTDKNLSNSIQTEISNYLNNFRSSSKFSYIYPNCDICNQPQNSFVSILEHFKNHHNQPGYVKCCKRKFFTKTNLVNHLELHENPRKFSCEFCDKKLTSKNNLEMHLKNFHESEDIKFECDFCGWKFSTKNRLKYHMKEFHLVIEKFSNFTCQKCSKNFKTKQRFKNHLESHKTESKFFFCEICGKNLKSNASLKEHIRNSHTNVDQPRLKCNLCNHYLKNPLSLRKHLNRHKQMSENIKCELCNKPCTTKASLDSHMRHKHLLKRIIACRYCEKKFKRAIDKDEHESTHTGIDLYHCEWCGAGFKFGANLRAHRKNLHPEEYERKRPKWIKPD
ncbi:hypothetical protein PVAND_015063 [Polypedilum vanderplanki]|uniref:C2H2-type domain-containing protein n=1 Tax=Polypedilum vanderplanki TaxID=319348 RepID=A0A9J6BBK7_POLVA|nr:hypothetical protein PVAND_015063 [Polypedilum vanderplanki]